MKKKTTPKARPARRARQSRTIAVQPPPGLAVAFKLIQESDWTGNAAELHAAAAYPHALALIDAINASTSDDGGQSVGDVLAKATKAMHGHCWSDEEIATMPELARNTGLYVGFAACWLLTTQINGGGAR